MGRFGESHDVPAVLDYQMLEAAAGAEERNSILTCIPNAREGAFKASIRAAGTADQAMKFRVFRRLIRRKPDRFEWLAERFGSMPDPVIRRDMRGITGV